MSKNLKKAITISIIVVIIIIAIISTYFIVKHFQNKAKIDTLDFEGLVYEGTSLSTLDKGVGHFENSSYFDGNVCLAAHNSSKFWAKLYTLHDGDKITYTSFLGTREYYVNSVEQISETDWSKLENTDENILTLITCVRKKPALRLCVQAIETN